METNKYKYFNYLDIFVEFVLLCDTHTADICMRVWVYLLAWIVK